MADSVGDPEKQRLRATLGAVSPAIAGYCRYCLGAGKAAASAALRVDACFRQLTGASNTLRSTIR